MLLQPWKKLKKSRFFYHFSKSPTAIISLAIFFILALSSIFSPWLATINPYDISMIDIMDGETPPSWMEDGNEEFLFGTDTQGRDLYSTMLYGMRVSLFIGLGAVFLQALIGLFIGLIAGYFGNRLDTLLMRFADIQLSISTLMVAILMSTIFQLTFGIEQYERLAVFFLISVIGLAEWPQYARTIRASVLAEKKKEYVEAARMIGLGPFRIIFRHILPNCLSPILVLSTIQIANAIMSEAALSFLGLGMPITKPSLGSLIHSGFDFFFSGSWWITIFPGIVLVVLILVINILGDWLRDYLNPKIYKK